MGDFELTSEELREVARFALASASPLLPLFEEACPTDPRPRAALDAARIFIDGAPRSRLQRTASLDAHRAAAAAPSEAARLAAQAAGDAASAAYLHPIAKAHQVGHLLRAAANAARIAELGSGDPGAATAELEATCRRASPVLVDVLRRYPPAPRGRSRTSELMADLDAMLRRA
ncbi:putative immunity protein [Nocardioides sp. R1-1]|uniref:putative immunity protein n=1 Tax=Nocardioides sp. R1-1 TaxID=3383502 RepID=UPI0038CF4034